MNVKRKIFDLIADHKTRFDQIPTLSEVRAVFAGMTENVDLHLEQLQREGLIKFDASGTITMPSTFPPARRIELCNPPQQITDDTRVPSDSGYLSLDLRGACVALDGELFAQVVADDSMIDAGIGLGDVAILKVAAPERGEIVATVENERMVLRRYVIIEGIPHFLAENPTRPDLSAAHDKTIQGVLWCLICTQPSGRGRRMPPNPKTWGMYQRKSTLESDFMAMLQAELRASPKNRSQLRSASGLRKVQTSFPRKKSVATKSAACGHDRMNGPTGISLNDGHTKVVYHSAPSESICDEQSDKPYGSAFTEALSQFVESSKPAAKSRC